jgi:hypothetical protein
MSTISTVAVEFIANTAKFVQGLAAVTKQTKVFSKDIKRDINAAGNDLLKLGKYASVAGAALYTGLSAGVLKSVNDLAKLNDEARKIGIGLEAYQALGAIAQDAGVNIETLRTATVALTKSLNEVEDGNQKTIAAFNELGISAEKLSQLTPDQRLAAISDALAEMTDESAKTRIGMELFGKSWTDISVVLKNGSDGLVKATEDAASLGKILAGEDVMAVKELDKAFQDLSDFIKTSFNFIAASIAPILSQWINQFLDWMKEGDNLSRTLQNTLYAIVTPIYMLAKALDGVIAAFYAMKGVLNLVAAGAVQFITYFLDGITLVASGWEMLINLIIEGWNKLPFNNKIKPIEFTSNLKQLAADFQGTAEELAKDADNSFTQAGESWKNGFGQTVIDVTAKVSNALAGVTSRAQNSAKVVTDGLKNARTQTQGVTTDYQAWYKEIERQQALAEKLDPTIGIRKEIEAIQELIAFQEKEGLQLAENAYLSQALREKQAQLFFELNPLFKQATQYLDSFASGFANAIVEGQNFGQALSNVFKSILRDITTMILRTTILQAIMASIGFINPAAANAFGVATGILNKANAPGRADGGSVMAGNMYRVGEAGPEYFVPGTNGYILPNDMAPSETIIVNQTINVETGVSQTVRAEMLGLLPRFKQEAMAGVLDAKQRGGSYARGLATA